LGLGVAAYPSYADAYGPAVRRRPGRAGLGASLGGAGLGLDSPVGLCPASSEVDDGELVARRTAIDTSAPSAPVGVASSLLLLDDRGAQGGGTYVAVPPQNPDEAPIFVTLNGPPP
jgi:hypothetical protein